MSEVERILASGNEAVARAARACGVQLGTGYPGTPSTEILEEFGRLGGKAQWAPNEKVALEVALGAAFGGGRSLSAMKHVGLNVASDVLFTAAYAGVSGALIVVSADDPGMSSSQNEQDNRRYAEAAAVPMLEPSDSQEAYDFFIAAVRISERWQIPVLFRLTTRICHSRTALQLRPAGLDPARIGFQSKPAERVMIPAHARPAHRRLRAKLAEIAAWAETSGLHRAVPGGQDLGVITSGVAFQHVREALPQAGILKLGLTHPLPIQAIRAFAGQVKRCLVVEEGDPFLVQALRSHGIPVEGKAEAFRFGELTVDRVRRLAGLDASPDPQPRPGKPPELCQGCPHRKTFEVLRDLKAIVAGDIGCYTLGVMPPFSAMDSQLCMGASIGVGLGLRHVLPDPEARRVVSVIGDSTFVHSGITGLVEMVYNPPATGHVVLILDNDTTAMTGLQEHPGTGRKLDGSPAAKLSLEEVARAVGVKQVMVLDPAQDSGRLADLLTQARQDSELRVIILRRPCLLTAGARRKADAARSREASAC